MTTNPIGLAFDDSHDQFDGYLDAPIPEARDRSISDVIASHQGTAEHVPFEPEHFEVLDLYAMRQASLAMRLGDPEPLHLALLALAMGGLRMGSRDSMVVLSACAHAAEVLGDPILRSFSVAAEIAGPTARSALLAFAARPAAERAIDRFGLRVGQDEGGARFEYDDSWPSVGG